MAVGLGRLVVFVLLISGLAYSAYQFPTETTLTHLRSLLPQQATSHQILVDGAPEPAPESLMSDESQVLQNASGSTGGRVAVCLVGAARAFELTGKTLITYVFEAYNNTDVFLHSPLDKDSHKFTLLKGASGLIRAKIFIPQRLPESDLQRQVLTGANSPNGIQGLLQYFHLVEGCLDLIQAQETKLNFTYDWIVRTRVDGYWSARLPPLSSFNSSYYHVADGSAYGGLNDRLGVGNADTSKAALSRLRLLPLIHEHGGRNLNSETAFRAQLNVSGVPFQVRSFPFCILSYRKYSWPPTYWGVPVMSIATKGALNGGKCRPCTTKASGKEAYAVLDKLGKGWGYPGFIDGIQLCDAHSDWEPQWREIFEKASGIALSGGSEHVITRTVAECIQEVEEFQKLWEVWDAPPAKVICTKG